MHISNLIEIDKTESKIDQPVKFKGCYENTFNTNEEEICNFFIDILNNYSKYSFELCTEFGRFKVRCQRLSSVLLAINYDYAELYLGSKFCCKYCEKDFRTLAILFVIDP